MPPPRRFRVRAHAKINLGLKIVGRRGDGYHELRTVFQTIALADRVAIAVGPGRGVELRVRGAAPAGEHNLAYRAAQRAAEVFGIRGRIELGLEKRLPLGAGLGGGSADAAAVLRALALAAPHPPAWRRVLELGAELGSDVPPLLLGGTVLGLGRGEEVYPLPDFGAWHCVLAMPRGAAVATPAAFAAWDRAHPQLTPPSESDTIMEFCSLVGQVLPAFRESLAMSRNREVRQSRTSKVHAGIENDFQAEVFSHSLDFPRIHQQLRRAQAAWVSLTGSGAAQYGLFAEATRAADTAVRLRARHQAWASRLVGRREFLRGLQVIE